MGISSSGLISGINSDQLISQLIALESASIKTIQTKQQAYQLKIASFSDISTKLSSFKAALDALNSSSKFNVKNASVTKTIDGDEILSVSASSTASAGSHSIQVKQLASASSKASQGWIDQNTTAIRSSGGTFVFKVGIGGASTTVSVSSTMTLQGLRDAINSASNTGVTASIINDGTGSNPYRLILTANDMGSSNEIYVTDNTIAQDLGFMNGSGAEPKKIEEAYAYTTNTYTGTANADTTLAYTGTINKTFLIEAVSTTTYKYSIDGGINWLGYNGAAYDSGEAAPTNGAPISANAAFAFIDGLVASNDNNEGVKVKFSAGNFAVGDRFTVDVFNPEMQEAKDAVITVDNATITKSSNTITDALQGVTMNLLKADSTATSPAVTLTVSSDTSSAKTSIKTFVDAYNTIMKAINSQLTYDTSTKKKNPLLGDPTLLEIRRKIANTVTGAVPGLSTSSYTNLSQIGITSDSKTGQLALDNTKLATALSNDPTTVSKLFIGIATATNAAVSYVSKTSKTQPGTYSISVSTAPQKATLDGDNNLSSTGLGTNFIITFGSNDTILMNGVSKTITPGTYTGVQLAAEIQTKLDEVVAGHTVSYESSRKFRITSPGGTYNWTTASAASTLGFNAEDSVVAPSVTDESDSSTGRNESLTFTYSSDKTATSPTYTTFSATLTAGSTINTIVNTLNSAFATNNVALSASNNSGKLKITSTDYGEDIWFQVSTDQGEASTHIWDTSGTRTDTGVDIVGSINAHQASGLGNVLTATNGFLEEGLKITVDSNQTGGFGSIAISSGIADRLSSSLENYTNSSTGMIKLKSDSLQKTIDKLTDQQKRIEDRLADKETRLRAQFARLEVLLSKYNTQSQYLTNQLSSLNKNWISNE